MDKYPSMVEYRRAISKPRYAFKEPSFAEGKFIKDKLGLPQMIAGGFVCAAFVKTDRESTWVVRMFTRPQFDLERRYQAVNDQLPKDFLLEAYFQKDGIQISGYEKAFPIVVIKFTEGKTLRRFLVDACRRSDTDSIKKLHKSFSTMVAMVRSSGLVHGDMSPDNMIVANDNQLQIKLIDYDNFWHHDCGQMTSNVGLSALRPPKKSMIMDSSHDDFSFVLYDAVLGLLSIEPKWGIEDDLYEQQMIISQDDLLKPETSSVMTRIKALLPNSYAEILDLYSKSS